MRRIIFIGTLHRGITPVTELEEILRHYSPHQILVEIVQEDIDQKNINSYSPEMQFALHFALQHAILAAGFDSTLNVFASGKTKKDNQKVIEQATHIIGKKSWKEFNVEKTVKILYTPEYYMLIDLKKVQQRQREMLKNINKIILKEGTIVIVTGCGNLKFFEEHIWEAEFPLRY